MAENKHQKRIDFLQNRFTPYFIIVLFTAAIMGIRFYMIPEWEWYFHLAGFMTQSVFMIAIWHLIKWLNSKLEKRIPFEEGPLKRMAIQVLLTLLVLTPLVGTSIYLVTPYLPSFVNKQFIVILCMLFVIMIVLLNFSFYVGYFFTNWQQSIEQKASLEIEAAELAKEKFDLQYHQLKNQVNPHYLFNTLTSLDGLIHTDPDLASEFVRHMAKVYRYVLQHKENEVVSLDEELDFMSHYIELLQIRYKDALQISCNISSAAKEKGIVMVTLQMLMDNAIKHNMLYPQRPLKLIFWDEYDYLIIHNNKQIRQQIEYSNGQGLQQLKQLYGYLSEKSILIEDTPEYFTVKIPLL